MPNPLGWAVVPQIVVTRERWSGGNIQGVPLVYPGQEVVPDQPVIRIESGEKGAVTPTTGAPSPLSLPEVPGNDVSATRESLNGKTATGVQQIGEIIPAGLRGRVVDITRRGGVVIESRAAVVQGVIGAGKQVVGILTMWTAGDPHRERLSLPPGALLCIPGPVNFTMLRQAMNSGVSGIIASSIPSNDLEGFLQTDLVRFIDRNDPEEAQSGLPDLTLMLTEGLGTMAMPAQTLGLLNQYQGSIALLAGTTSVRQHIYPELIISLPEIVAHQQWEPITPDPSLVVGAQVRVCSGSYEGVTGQIDYLFTHQQLFYSAIRTRAARLRLEDGGHIVVPLTVLERIG